MPRPELPLLEAYGFVNNRRYQYVQESKKPVLNLQTLFQRFKDEVLSRYEYKVSGNGHLNCCWATEAFCNFCTRNSIPSKAIYFVWPTEGVVKKLKSAGILPSYTDDRGESHIAPVINDTIVDVTAGQFFPGKEVLMTPFSKWQSVYGKFGYGTNQYKGKTVFLDTYTNLIQIPGLQINPLAPSYK